LAFSSLKKIERSWTVPVAQTPKASNERKSLLPWIFDSVEYYPHQIEGIRLLAGKTNFLLADDMGLGKSIQAITVFAVDVVRGWCKTAIVVCPVTLKGNWADEIEKFTSFPYLVLEGSPKVRAKQLIDFAAIEGPKILVVNYEQVAAHLDELNSFRFDVAIFDEAHYMKNPTSKRTKACLNLRTRRTFELTGSPMLNHVNELWALLHKLDPNRFPKYWTFLNRYAVFGGYKDKQIVGVKNEKELTEILGDYMLRRLKSEVLNLKEPQIIQRRVDLLPAQKKLYQQVIEDMRLPSPDGADPTDIENALTKFLRLKQICGTTFPFTGQDDSGKLDLAVEDALELLGNGHKIVVFTQFRDVLEQFCRRLKAAGASTIFQLHGGVKQEDRQPIVKEWGATSGGVAIVCMLQVAGIGLNMTSARHALFLDKLFVPMLNRQAIDRIHRIGQDETQPVQVFEYITRNTIENRVEQILRTKTKLFGEIVESDPNWKKKLYEAVMEEEVA
jgi:SNF2 family DNA or RNA helicase